MAQLGVGARPVLCCGAAALRLGGLFGVGGASAAASDLFCVVGLRRYGLVVCLALAALRLRLGGLFGVAASAPDLLRCCGLATLQLRRGCFVRWYPDSVFILGIVLHVLTTLSVVLLVLLHSGRGGGLSDMFGGGLGASAAGSTMIERNLDRITVVAAIIFGFATLGLALMMDT